MISSGLDNYGYIYIVEHAPDARLACMQSFSVVASAAGRTYLVCGGLNNKLSCHLGNGAGQFVKELLINWFSPGARAFFSIF